MKQVLFSLLVFSLLLSGCGQRSAHFLTDAAYRTEVESTLEARLGAHDGALTQFYAVPEGVSLKEKEALEFLYAYMPLADMTDYPTEFYLQNVRATFLAEEELGWGVPERELRHFVLPVRVNNERLDSSRVVFYRELKPRVEGLTMAEAILEVNHWCHEKVTYQPSDARTLSPLACVRNALGRCGEESTFCVAALRSVGIPARQVYTPRWAHTDDNHAWVEAWADGAWHFIGACEPEPVLDLGWFNAPASRAMLTHTKVFGRYDGPEEVVLESPNYTEINLTHNYAETAELTIRTLPGARVDFCIYNYAEFYPALTKYADADGKVTLSAGLGDMLVWASFDGRFGCRKVSFGTDKEVAVVIDSTDEPWNDDPVMPGGCRASLTIVPPPEKARMPEVTPEQRAENDRRFAREDSLRHAYEASFPTRERALSFAGEQGYDPGVADLILASRGNWPVITAFLSAASCHERAVALLGSLSGKDLRDISMENLMDSYEAKDAVLCPRVENEFLWSDRAFFLSALPLDQQVALSDPEALAAFVRGSVTLLDDPLMWRIPMSPASVWKARVADARSRDIFFVALARTLGVEAQKDPVTGKIQYRQGDEWLDVDFGGTKAVKAPTGTLKLAYAPTKAIPNPGYYSHFTISKLVSGRPQLLTFDEGEVDMGGGVDWAHVFRTGYPLEQGQYLLVSGNRCSDGSVPVAMRFFEVRAGESTTVDLEIRQPEDKVAQLGTFDAESLFTVMPSASSVIPSEAKESSILSVTGRGFYALAILDPGKEPTNHVLRDLCAAREGLEAWGRPILLLCESEKALEQLQAEIAAGRYGTLPSTVRLGIDSDGIRSTLAALSGSGRLPLVMLADSFNRVFYVSEGYTIGLGERLLDTIHRL